MTQRTHGGGSLYLRGTTWWLKWYEDGRPRYESSHTDRKGTAAKLLAQRVAAVTEGRSTGPEGAKLTLRDLRALLEADYLARENKSWDRAARAFDTIAAALGTTRKAATVKPRHLAQYVAGRLAASAARATIQKELAALRRGYNVALELELLPWRPKFPSLGEIKNARCEFVEDFEWALVRPHVPGWWQDLGDIALATGWRPHAELRPLPWAAVDQDAGLLRLAKYHTKNSDARAFPYLEAPTVADALARRLAATQAAEQQTGQPVLSVFHQNGRAIQSHTFYDAWNRAWRVAFGKDTAPKHPHDFRRSGVRNLELAGVSRDVAKRLVGHRTDSMYSRYCITTVDDLRAAVRRVHQPAPATPEPAVR
jgi:site-specific recombinase XerD